MNAFARRDVLKLSPLALAALPAWSAQAQAPNAHGGGSPMMFDVRSFGATGTGKQLDTPAVNAAIDAAEAAGGGMVVFPGGTYLCFSIRLKSHVHLFLAQGAVIQAAASPLPGAGHRRNGRRLRRGRAEDDLRCVPGLWP